jgi:hypothetical protein
MFEAVVRVYRTSQIPVSGATVAAALYEAKRMVSTLATPDGFAHELVGVLHKLSNTMHPAAVQFPPVTTTCAGQFVSQRGPLLTARAWRVACSSIHVP